MDERLPSFDPVRPWVNAAGGIWLFRPLIRSAGDFEALYLRLATLARAQYAAELAHARIRAVDRGEEPSEERMQLTLMQAADVHAFLVSSALYWRTLHETVHSVTRPDVRSTLAAYEAAAATAKTARDHMEHLNERIKQGRVKGYGEVMPVEAFRKAVGAFDGSQIIFGTETFPLDHMIRAIRDSAAAIAPPFQTTSSLTFEPRVDGADMG